MTRQANGWRMVFLTNSAETNGAFPHVKKKKTKEAGFLPHTTHKNQSKMNYLNLR